ncbi:MAG: T9SS C-terminal target domain-containing protein [Ignavibacteriae bacterium]|nr:MAG: T9SS C-terminal target domain-containing protein [Ignavibacteriota bacterium]
MSNTYNSWPQGNQGTAWLVNNGGWTSTNSNGGGPFSQVKNAPRNAVAIAGIYNWAISVQPINDTINEVRWKLVEVNNKYWFGGTVQTKATTTKFNGIGFGFNNDMEATQVNLLAVKVDIGAPIIVPKAPWQAFYVDQWGILGNRFGGWKFMPDTLVGNAGIGGTAVNTGWTAVSGLIDQFNVADGAGLLITGKAEFIGGGFEAKNSLRIALSNTATGKIVGTGDSTRWDGSESGVGYLFIPQSGANAQETWANNKSGNFGTIAPGPWLLTDGTMLGAIPQMPNNAVGGAGVYNFKMSVVHKSTGNNDVTFTLYKPGYTYVATSSVAAPATEKFNSLAFAFNTNASTKSLKLTDVKVDTTSASIPVGVKESEDLSIPTEYMLAQNYPNPFNPTTTIQYEIPMTSHVSLTIYDMLGRAVATLVNQTQSASRYTVQFDAGRMSSGVYFYRIDARSENGTKDFTSVKKLVLMK